MNFRNLSIRRKLMSVILFTCGIVLFTTVSAIFVSEAILFLTSLRKDQKILASIIGGNSAAAVVFNDPKSAQETLGRLAYNQHVIFIWTHRFSHATSTIRKGVPTLATAYSYLRFSTPEQSKGDSLRRQSDKARDYANDNGLDLDESLTLKDLGVSAFRGQNSETGCLGDFLQAVEAGLVEPGSFLLVESLDRISRDAAIDAIYLLKRICDGGVTVVTLLDKMVYTRDSLRNDTTQILISLLTFIRSNEESKTKSSRLKAAWGNKRKNIGTVPLTARAPAWLKLNKDVQRFEVIEDRAEMIRLIFKQYVGGVGPSGIVRQLNQQGLLPWGRGVIWNQSYVTKILSSPAVYGAYTPHTVEHINGKMVHVPLDQIAGYFPVVVSEDVFLQAKELKECRGLKGRKITVALANSFSRLSRCPVCDSAMVYVNKGKAWLYLACSSAKQGAKLCFYRSVPYAQLEDSFLEAVRAGLKLPVDRDKLDGLETGLAMSEAQMGKSIRERSEADQKK